MIRQRNQDATFAEGIGFYVVVCATAIMWQLGTALASAAVYTFTNSADKRINS